MFRIEPKPNRCECGCSSCFLLVFCGNNPLSSSSHHGHYVLTDQCRSRTLAPLKFAKRWEFHFGQSCVSPMHRFAVMAEVLHCKPLGIAGFPCALRPSVTIRVQCDALYL